MKSRSCVVHFDGIHLATAFFRSACHWRFGLKNCLLAAKRRCPAPGVPAGGCHERWARPGQPYYPPSDEKTQCVFAKQRVTRERRRHEKYNELSAQQEQAWRAKFRCGWRMPGEACCDSRLLVASKRRTSAGPAEQALPAAGSLLPRPQVGLRP